MEKKNDQEPVLDQLRLEMKLAWTYIVMKR